MAWSNSASNSCSGGIDGRPEEAYNFFSLCKGFTELHNSGEFPLAEGVFLCCCQSPASRPEVGTSLGSPSLRGVGSRETTSGYLSLAL